MSDESLTKKCAICGEIVEQGELKCPSCGKGVFETEKSRKYQRSFSEIVSIKPTQTSTIDKVVEYFYQPITSPAFCSDNQCPCNETPIKKGKGFLYVSKEAVEFRRDARSEKELKAKAAKYIESLGGGDRTAVVLDHMMYKAALICETAAKQRGLNLKVAAADASYAWEKSKAPLRATPLN